MLEGREHLTLIIMCVTVVDADYGSMDAAGWTCCVAGARGGSSANLGTVALQGTAKFALVPQALRAGYCFQLQFFQKDCSR